MERNGKRRGTEKEKPCGTIGRKLENGRERETERNGKRNTLFLTERNEKQNGTDLLNRKVNKINEQKLKRNGNII